MKSMGILETIHDSAPICILMSGNEGNTLYSNPRSNHKFNTSTGSAIMIISAICYAVFYSGPGG